MRCTVRTAGGSVWHCHGQKWKYKAQAVFQPPMLSINRQAHCVPAGICQRRDGMFKGQGKVATEAEEARDKGIALAAECDKGEVAYSRVRVLFGRLLQPP